MARTPKQEAAYQLSRIAHQLSVTDPFVNVSSYEAISAADRGDHREAAYWHRNQAEMHEGVIRTRSYQPREDSEYGKERRAHQEQLGVPTDDGPETHDPHMMDNHQRRRIAMAHRLAQAAHESLITNTSNE